jgi:peroxiredoxin
MQTVHSMCNQTQADVDSLEASAKRRGVKLRIGVIADSSGKYVHNGLTFDTAAEAVAYGNDLSWRWTLVQSFRVELAD